MSGEPVGTCAESVGIQDRLLGSEVDSLSEDGDADVRLPWQALRWFGTLPVGTCSYPFLRLRL